MNFAAGIGTGIATGVGLGQSGHKTERETIRAALEEAAGRYALITQDGTQIDLQVLIDEVMVPRDTPTKSRQVMIILGVLALVVLATAAAIVTMTQGTLVGG
jgi:hypothetical protein